MTYEMSNFSVSGESRSLIFLRNSQGSRLISVFIEFHDSGAREILPHVAGRTRMIAVERKEATKRGQKTENTTTVIT